MIQILATIACWTLSALVVAAVAVTAWAVSTEERTDRVVEWIRFWRQRRKGK